MYSSPQGGASPGQPVLERSTRDNGEIEQLLPRGRRIGVSVLGGAEISVSIDVEHEVLADADARGAAERGQPRWGWRWYVDDVPELSVNIDSLNSFALSRPVATTLFLTTPTSR